VQRTDIDPLLLDIVYEGEHTCDQSAHSLPQHRQDQSSAFVGVKASTATSESEVTYEEISGSVAGVRSMSPATSGGHTTTRDEASGSTSRAEFMASGSGSTTGSRLVSPAMSQSQVTYNVISESTGSWSAPLEAGSAMDDLHSLDLNSAFDDFCHEHLGIGSDAPPSSPKSPN
jgi:hypothetical protein